MLHTWLKIPLICVIFSILLSFSLISHASKKEVVIGVSTVWGAQTAIQMWQPTITYLNKTIPNKQFILKPLELNKTSDAVKSNRVDFILTDPGNYIKLESLYGISRLATLKIKKQNKSSSQFAAVIFTRKNRDDINFLNDLRNKSFMGVNKNSFGGFQMAWLEFKKHNINPFKDFSLLQFSGFPQDKVVYAVLNGEIDAGTVRTSTLEIMAKKGLININDFKIINRKGNNNFPFLHSTQLYPEWPFAKLKNTANALAKEVTIALLNLDEINTAAIYSQSTGWSIPLDYSPVRNLFIELNLAPYKLNSQSFFEKYWGYVLLLLLLFLQPLLFYIYKLRTELRADEKKLALSETEWSNALDFLDETIYMVDLNDRIIRANKAYYKSHHTNANEAVGQLVTRFAHPKGEDISCKICQARKDLLDTVIILEIDDPLNTTKHPLEINIKVIRDSKNKPVGVIQKTRDLTESRKIESELRRRKSLFKELLNATPQPLVVANADGTIVLVNTRFEKEFGYSRDEIIGYKIEKLMPKTYHKNHISLRSNYSKKPYNFPMGQDIKFEGLHKDGSLIPIDISLSPFIIENETLIIATIHNISERIEKEIELKRLASFPEYDPNPILEFKKDGTLTYANPASIELFPEILKNSIQHEIFSDLEEEYSSLEKKHELTRVIEINDSTFEQKIIYNPDTKLFRTYIWDITSLKNLTQKMTYQASHDLLTKLINRREFERRLELAVEEAQHFTDKTHSLCFMDLDQFKAVNDSCGHAAGDELLIQLSAAINAKTREIDTFARLGGDEFGLLLLACPIAKAASIAEGIRKTVEEYRFHWDNKIFKVGISIGIVTISHTSGSMKEIQSAADTACYLAKEHGRNRVHIYEVDSTEIAKHTDETNWLNRINLALDNDNFVLYFQQIASLSYDKDDHYEVLIRMLDKDGNTIPPNSFIPAAERFNIMSSVDSWVIKKILLIMQKEQYININFSINLSGQSLSDTKFMDNCITQIVNSKVDATRLCFEITETAMIANLTDAIRSVSTLQELGCKIALDDFGSGLSSFAYLKNLPVDYLKIDGSLIKDLENDKVNVTMVESIIHIGHSMQLETIAEYVENDAILCILRKLNIDFVQGYGVAKPVPLHEISLDNNKFLRTISMP